MVVCLQHCGGTAAAGKTNGRRMRPNALSPQFNPSCKFTISSTTNNTATYFVYRGPIHKTIQIHIGCPRKSILTET